MSSQKFEILQPPDQLSLFIKSIWLLESQKLHERTVLPFYADGYPGMMFHHSLNGLKVNPHQNQEALVQKSQLNYTIVRPSAFTDKNPGGKCHVGFDGNFKPPKLKILRFEVASFLLKQLETDQWSGKTVSLSN